ncbi:MAG TPA: M14 family zinc carboxypeptidase [Candidatus Paceibacterota bacterium]
MRSLFTKPTIVTVIVFAALGISLFTFVNWSKKTSEIPPAENLKDFWPKQKVIGTSVEGRDITAYNYGTGEKQILFVGGMHGGYEWNSVLLAYKFMDYLKENPNAVPKNLTVTVIPSINPDGVFAVVGKESRFAVEDVSTSQNTLISGRFNAHKVDLNRNFDCKWKSEGVWKGEIVSAGTKPFSEPESLALRNFVLENNPEAVIFWHSQANAVYASECKVGILPKTLDIMNAYSTASGYPAVKSFDSYEVTGDAEGWLASINIPAITVELKTHGTIEWDKNLAGIKAIMLSFQIII